MAKYFLPIFLFVSNLCFAQKLFYVTYDWEKTPVIFIPDEKEKHHDVVIVSQKKILEVEYETDGHAVIYETHHTIYHVNNSNGVDDVNKCYVPLGNTLEQIEVKARCVNGANKVTHFNSSTMKRIDDLDGKGPYNIFAIAGVEANSDVEILYTLKKNYSENSYQFVQGYYPIRKYESHIISPPNLVYETKSYNGLKSFQKDTLYPEKNHLILADAKIDPAKDERYADEKPNLKAYAYQLAFNTSRQKSRLYNWSIISRDYYNSLFTIENKDSKAIEKTLNKNKLLQGKTEEDKIRNIDSYLKTSCEISDEYESSDLNDALQAKKIGYRHAIKFYIAALKTANIPFELVLTSPRDELKFDPAFPSLLYTREYLLFFPTLNKYLTPLSVLSRLGMPDPDMMNTDGLFIKEIDMSGVGAASAKIKTLPQTSFSLSFHNTDVVAKLNFDLSKTSVNVRQTLGGYNAYYVQPIYRFLNQEQKDEISKSYYLVSGTKNVKNLLVSNFEENEVFLKPFQVTYDAEHDDFLEQANDKYIFKVGLAIGPQVELYDAEPRKWPADVSFPHSLKRTIEVIIPDGYKPINLTEINSDVSCTSEGSKIAVFTSSAQVNDNKIIITIYEDYKNTEYTLANYEGFRSVINAAADFNKKKIVFAKK